jgi:hypothetical protein
MAKTNPPLCPNFNEARKDFNIPDNMYEAIGPFSNYQNIISYLKKKLIVQ